MCGIVGIVVAKDAKLEIIDIVISGLKDLQYRGYDSAGYAYIEERANKLHVKKIIGKVENLPTQCFETRIAIGHTRWATNGKVNLANAHPQHFDGLAIVHNGIIENTAEIKKLLLENHYSFSSETDTEILLKLIHLKQREFNESLIDVLCKVVDQLEGSFAVALIDVNNPSNIFAIKRGANLVIGNFNGMTVLASDQCAMPKEIKSAIFLEDNDVLIADCDNIAIYNNFKQIKRMQTLIDGERDSAHHANGETFMEKEMNQQPAVLEKIFSNFPFASTAEQVNFKNFKCVNIIACGSSYFAGLVAKRWFERFLNIKVAVEIASEFEYLNHGIDELFLFISQSGETADTLVALKKVRGKHKTLSLVNTKESVIARASDVVIYTNAGRELSVASTKTFTAQLACLLCLLVCQLEENSKILHEFKNIKIEISAILRNNSRQIEEAAKILANSKNTLCIGKNLCAPIASECALKLKELAYLHAESLSAGELKHGPLALVEKDLPIIVIAPHDIYFSKIFSNILEISSRDGKLVIFTDAVGKEKLKEVNALIIALPKANCFTIPFFYTVGIQLLALKTALIKGNDLDYPRNLAKAVTVE